MGGQAYLIDTNVAIEYIGEVLPEKALTVLDDIIDGQFYISVINKIELLALVNKLTIITRNTKDFIRIEGLEMVNPYEI